MAAKGNSQPNERSRVRFMLVEVDGTSSDVQQLAQILAGAVKGPQVVINHSTPPALPMSVPAPATVQEVIQPGDSAAADALSSNQPPVSAAARSLNGAKKKHRTPKLVSGLEFTSGQKSLKEFWDEQGDPKEDSKRYLVIAQWLKVYRNIEEVGADHAYSAYRFLNLNVPDDVLSVFRGLKKQAWVDGGSKPGQFRITHVGENQLKAT